MENVYIAPDAPLTAEVYQDIVNILEASSPATSERWNQEFAHYASPSVMALNDYLRQTYLFTMLKRYRNLLVSAYEDVPEISDVVVKISETCKAADSIQEQMIRVILNIYEVDLTIHNLKDKDRLDKHIQSLLESLPGASEQLKLDLKIDETSV
jgi:hypothetical protein